MSAIPLNFADDIAKECYKHFEGLPKKGKPQPKKEWTLLAAILMSCDSKKCLKVVSMSTGTKCLGFSQLSKKGDLICDSHAEVLTRRAFIKFLFNQMNLILDKKESSVLCFNELKNKFEIFPGIQFHFFVSHVPCGDAAIFPKSTVQNDLLDQAYDNNLGPMSKKLKLDVSGEKNFDNNATQNNSGDIHRTGAKCVLEGVQDPKNPGKDYHVVGALRTKPGRGDPTWSMSCSDKIALWNVCGLQGALITYFIEKPIYISNFIVGKCPFNKTAIERAIVSRFGVVTDLPSHYLHAKPLILQSSLIFEYSKEKLSTEHDKVVPCPSSIIWCDVPDYLEVSVNGRKQGIVKRNLNKPSSRIGVCKALLYEEFLSVMEKMSLICDEYKRSDESPVTYLDYKMNAKKYQSAKQAIFKVFPGWMQKPAHLQNFVL